MPTHSGPRAATASASRCPNGAAHRCAYPTASAGCAKPRSASAAASSAWIRAGADGSLKTAVPTETADAPGEDELQGVEAAADAAHAEDRHLRQRLVHLPDAAQRHRPDRRAGQPAGDPAEHRPHRVGVDDQPEQGVDHRQPVGAGVGHRAGDADDVGDVGAELGVDRLRRVGGGPDGADDVGGGDRVAGEHLAAALDVRAADVDLEPEHAGHAAQPGGQLGEVLDPGAGDRDEGPGARARPARAGPRRAARRCRGPAGRSS